jgi:hypothetical protein
LLQITAVTRLETRSARHQFLVTCGLFAIAVPLDLRTRTAALSTTPSINKPPLHTLA